MRSSSRIIPFDANGSGSVNAIIDLGYESRESEGVLGSKLSSSVVDETAFEWGREDCDTYA